MAAKKKAKKKRAAKKRAPVQKRKAAKKRRNPSRRPKSPRAAFLLAALSGGEVKYFDGKGLGSRASAVAIPIRAVAEFLGKRLAQMHRGTRVGLFKTTDQANTILESLSGKKR